MRRRNLLLGALAVPLAAAAARLALVPARADDPAEGIPFDTSTVRQMARELAAQPFAPRESDLPEVLEGINYDQYRGIRFIQERALWRDTDLRFQVQFFHRGFLFTNRVDLYEVTEGHARPIHYATDLFNFDGINRPPEVDIGFAGFRVHAPLNRDDYFDEVCTFLGATYFRAVAKGQGYGISARGLSLKTGNPEGEEVPYFKAFWIERPAPGVNSIVAHALLDSESAAASFRFTIRPGDTTVFDVEMSLYPRVEITEPGIATLTSMFLFGPIDRLGIDDYRSAVHDSDGLLMWNGRGEQLWRPLANPTSLQISQFFDVNPRGFGLMQRERSFPHFQDTESHFERRPSVWVEPIGDWGEGSVSLVEIPTQSEAHDNIVAFWRPRQPLRAGGEYPFTYRLHWGWDNPWQTDLARIIGTRVGEALGDDLARLFVIDAAGGKLAERPDDAPPIKFDVWASAGKLRNLVHHRNDATGGWRMTFELLPEDNPVIELRVQLRDDTGPLTEVWIYRWTS